MNEETLNKLDDNNSKAKEIVKSVIDIIVNTNEAETDPIVLLDAAADYLQDNEKIFNSIM